MSGNKSDRAKEQSQSRNEQFMALWPAVQAKASFLRSRYAQHLDADEIANELALLILERADTVADFLSQAPAYVLQFAEWRWLGARQATRQHDLAQSGRWSMVDVDADPGLADVLPATAPTPAELADVALTAPLVREAMATLPEHIAAALIAVYGYGQKQADVAREMGRPASTVRRWVSQGRAMLADELAALAPI